jgi:uncharacterized protein (DUF2126 family)
MTIRISLNHKTTYVYDRHVTLSPQVVRLRPAAHCRTPICSYSLTVEPSDHFISWQQDPQGNFLARLVFPDRVKTFDVEVDLIADMTVINPFDFFLEPEAESFPFEYESWLASELKPFLELRQHGEAYSAFLDDIDCAPKRTNDFLVELNQKVQQAIEYVVRLEPGVQTPEKTLTLRRGSCRDSAWLLVNLLRNLGLAARFVSGYLVQLVPDVKSLDGPSGPSEDFTDLHAWTEVYLPGAGWVGLDPTSGLLTGEGHIPLSCTPEPASAAPISGSVEDSSCEFRHAMSIERVYEDPRVTKPYSTEQWAAIENLGHAVDQRLADGDVRLTMGGEPTFVSIDDMDGAEWTMAAVGPMKLGLATDLLYRLDRRFASGGLLHFGQGKWYPGEPLPRWAISSYWRVDGQPIWRNRKWCANPTVDLGHTTDDAVRFARSLAGRLGVEPDHVAQAYEDVLYYAWKERRLPENVDVRDSKLEEEEERERLARIFERGVTAPTGCFLPLEYQSASAHVAGGWRSGLWPVRADELFLAPGDSPMGLRLPLESLTWVPEQDRQTLHEPDPLEARAPLPLRAELREAAPMQPAPRQQTFSRQMAPAGLGAGPRLPDGYSSPGFANGENGHGAGYGARASDAGEGAPQVIRYALCVEPRNGRLHIFMPPVERLEHYLDLVAAIEDTAEAEDLPIVVEGYAPPHDHRVRHIKITPDPGVIEVNVQPAQDWGELVEITMGIYEDARQSRLGTEKFDLDGGHTGTGGGNHVVLGGRTPADSPFLRRPDLLRSIVGYWHNHPALSYLFSGKFVGPTSQAPRVDEGRRDAIYELQIAFDQIPDDGPVPPWLVDRVFRHLLVDLTGNTHRAEFCIDKLYSPDTAMGRLGLVEFRAFEMPPHPRMSLTQQLLLRALVARFWEKPYREKLVDWGTSIHDRFLLPYFLQKDFDDVIEETRAAGIALESSWFAPHFEFRFPKVGELAQGGLFVEFRDAIEPWYVLGEEPGGGYTARYVDSSVERMQVKVQGMTDERHFVTCNGRRLPLHPTGTEGEFVAGVRYRGWRPPSCLHPTIPSNDPLVFDVVDEWMQRSIGGCRYHVGHPGGINPETFPVNAYEAESRRVARFFKMGHTPATTPVPPVESNPRFPLTLDLRREG